MLFGPDIEVGGRAGGDGAKAGCVSVFPRSARLPEPQWENTGVGQLTEPAAAVQRSRVARGDGKQTFPSGRPLLSRRRVNSWWLVCSSSLRGIPTGAGGETFFSVQDWKKKDPSNKFFFVVFFFSFLFV